MQPAPPLAPPRSPVPAADGRRRWIAVGLLALAAAAPYALVLDAPFVFDDVKLVLDNERLRAGWPGFDELLATFDITSDRWADEPLRPNYRPLRFLSYHLDYAVGRLVSGDPPGSPPRPAPFRVTNVLLHVANTLLVALLARLALRRRDDEDPGPAARARRGRTGFAALAAGVLFALHPLATEAVTYISGRRDVLCLFFFLLAATTTLRARPDESPGLLALLAAPLLLGLALLSKEMAVTLPAVLLVLEVARGARWSPRRLVAHALLWAIALLAMASTLSNQALIAAPVAAGGANVAWTAGRYAARYLLLALFPFSQSIDYSFDAISPSTGLLSPWTTLPSLALGATLALGALIVLWRARRPAAPEGGRELGLVAAGALVFLGSLAPVLQLVPIPERFAERFAYLPLVGLVLGAGILLARMRARDAALGSVTLGVAAVVLGTLCVRRNAEYESPLRLWTSACRAQPECARAHLGRANALKAAGRLPEAVLAYDRAIEVFSRAPDVPLHHGSLLQARTQRAEALGRLSEEDPALVARAIEDLRLVLSLKDTDGVEIAASPAHTLLHFNLGGLLLRQGDREGAAAEYEAVLSIGGSPAIASGARFYLGEILLSRGDARGALARFREAYGSIPRDDPSKFPVAVKIADLLIDLKEPDEALVVVAHALEDGARGENALFLKMREAKALDRKGEMDASVRVLEGILAIDPDHAPALITLAGIEELRGRHDDAEARYQRVLRKDPANKEALEGLQKAQLRRRLEADPATAHKAPEAERQVLEAILGKAKAARKGGELLAAREFYSSLAARAAAAKDQELQVEALTGIGGVEALLGRPRAAVARCREAVAIALDNPEASHNLGLLHHGSLPAPEAARGPFATYLRALGDREGVAAAATLALAEAAAPNNPSRALELLREGVTGGLDAPELHQRIGELCEQLSRWGEALDAFKAYIEKATGGPEREEVRKHVQEVLIPRLLDTEG